MNRKKKIIYLLAFFAISLVIAYIHMPWGTQIEYDTTHGCIGDIECPRRFVRVDSGEYATFMRRLPLKKEKSVVKLSNGGNAKKGISNYSYRIVDLPLLSDIEQCADMAIRLRSEYLYQNGHFADIMFIDNNRIPFRYFGGRIRFLFEAYLKTIYHVANTESLTKQMTSRNFTDMQIGDVLVYKVREGKKYGHAVTVVDMCVNPKTGQKLYMVANGATPACDMWIIKNTSNNSPWFPLESPGQTLKLGPFTFHKNELRYW